MAKANTQNKTEFNKDTFYLGLIFLLWLIAYVACQILFDQKLGWDEISYLTTAKGIASDFDFSSRTTTTLGLLKYNFPQHTHHYPLYSAYLALFFKLFGTSLQVAYFSTWLAALVTCIFIYLLMILLTDGNKIISFFFSVLFLFLPSILSYTDSAMMEIPGCALVTIFSYFIFKDISKGKINPVLMGIAAMWLYFFKSTFIGVLFGFFVLVLIAHRYNLTVFKLPNKTSLSVSLISYTSTVLFLYFIFKKIVFLPLAPMMNFHRRQEELEIYADFAGGFFRDPIGNMFFNLKGLFDNVILHYLPSFLVLLIPGSEGLYTSTPTWCEFGQYFIVFLFVIIFACLSWKNLFPKQKLFILFTLVSIIIFNIVFSLIADNGVGVRSRYNLIYLPLLLISSGTLLWVNKNYLKPFITDHKIASIFITGTFILLIYIPYLVSSFKVSEWNKTHYHSIAHNSTQIPKKILGELRPDFIYFHAGQHTTWDLYPVRVVLMEASNEQLKKINSRLPHPIDFLFLYESNQLFKENQDFILKGQPIVDNWYTFYGIDPEAKIIIYKLNPDKNT